MLKLALITEAVQYLGVYALQVEDGSLWQGTELGERGKISDLKPGDTVFVYLHPKLRLAVILGRLPEVRADLTAMSPPAVRDGLDHYGIDPFSTVPVELRGGMFQTGNGQPIDASIWERGQVNALGLGWRLGMLNMSLGTNSGHQLLFSVLGDLVRLTCGTWQFGTPVCVEEHFEHGEAANLVRSIFRSPARRLGEAPTAAPENQPEGSLLPSGSTGVFTPDPEAKPSPSLIQHLGEAGDGQRQMAVLASDPTQGLSEIWQSDDGTLGLRASKGLFLSVGTNKFPVASRVQTLDRETSLEVTDPRGQMTAQLPGEALRKAHRYLMDAWAARGYRRQPSTWRIVAPSDISTAEDPSAVIGILPDGTIVNIDRSGSEIRMGNGTIRISPRGDLILSSGGNIVLEAGQDVIVRARHDLELVADQGSTRIKAQESMQILGVNGLILENRGSMGLQVLGGSSLTLAGSQVYATAQAGITLDAGPGNLMVYAGSETHALAETYVLSYSRMVGGTSTKVVEEHTADSVIFGQTGQVVVMAQAWTMPASGAEIVVNGPVMARDGFSQNAPPSKVGGPWTQPIFDYIQEQLSSVSEETEAVRQFVQGQTEVLASSPAGPSTLKLTGFRFRGDDEYYLSGGYTPVLEPAWMSELQGGQPWTVNHVQAPGGSQTYPFPGNTQSLKPGGFLGYPKAVDPLDQDEVTSALDLSVSDTVSQRSGIKLP